MVSGATSAFTGLVADVVGFLPWWYTRGLRRMALYCLGSIESTARSFGVSVWLKNLLVPMDGMYDWQSRIISFVVRVFQLIFRGIGLCLWSVFMFAVLIGYVVAPLVAFLLIVFEISLLFV